MHIASRNVPISAMEMMAEKVLSPSIPISSTRSSFDQSPMINPKTIIAVGGVARYKTIVFTSTWTKLKITISRIPKLSSSFTRAR